LTKQILVGNYIRVIGS